MLTPIRKLLRQVSALETYAVYDKVAVATIQKVILTQALALVGSDSLELNDAEKNFVDKKEKIQAIKSYRDRTKVGLKEAKDAVEDYMEKTLGTRYFSAY